MLNKIKTLFLVSVIPFLVTACTVPVGMLTQYVEQVCDLSVEERMVVRTNLDSATYPHTVRINCKSLQEDSE